MFKPLKKDFGRTKRTGCSLVIMDRWNQYYENYHPTKTNVQIQCNSNKNFYDRNGEGNPKIHTKPQKILDSWSNPEQKEQCWDGYYSRLQDVINTGTVYLGTKPTCTTKEQNIRNKT